MMDDVRLRLFAIGHLSDSGDLKMILYFISNNSIHIKYTNMYQISTF